MNKCKTLFTVFFVSLAYSSLAQASTLLGVKEARLIEMNRNFLASQMAEGKLFELSEVEIKETSDIDCSFLVASTATEFSKKGEELEQAEPLECQTCFRRQSLARVYPVKLSCSKMTAQKSESLSL